MAWGGPWLRRLKAGPSASSAAAALFSCKLGTKSSSSESSSSGFFSQSSSSSLSFFVFDGGRYLRGFVGGGGVPVGTAPPSAQ